MYDESKGPYVEFIGSDSLNVDIMKDNDGKIIVGIHYPDVNEVENVSCNSTDETISVVLNIMVGGIDGINLYSRTCNTKLVFP